uniref:Alpha-glucosidase n=1 Tax=Acrobeloides nanus TaxID=290746 RepID=A0A914DF41_9BILA
ICKFGYLSTSEVETVVNRTVSNGIPFDVAWVDINYANGSKDFTLNKTSFGGLPAYADYLHSQNMKLIVIVDPGIAVDYEVFERGLQQGASFIEWASSELVPNDVNGKYPLTNNTNLMLGAVWPLVHVAFPDFLDPTGNTTKWWINEFTAFHQQNLILPTLDNIEIFGYAYSPNIATAKLNGNPVQILSSSYSPFTQVLNISSPALIDLNKNRPNWILTWNNVGVANEKDGIVGDKTGNADS